MKNILDAFALCKTGIETLKSRMVYRLQTYFNRTKTGIETVELFEFS